MLTGGIEAVFGLEGAILSLEAAQHPKAREPRSKSGQV